MIHRDRAVDCVRTHGTRRDIARLDYIMDGKPPAPEIVADLFAGQNADGGWPAFWSGGMSSLDATCFRTAQAQALGLVVQEPVRAGAVPFLIKRQHEAGSWEEDAGLGHVAPVWAKPGDEAARLYLTANCGYWLAVLTADSNVVLRASGYLLDHVADNGRIPSFGQTHWLAAGLWYRLGQYGMAERVMQYLDEAFVPKLDAGALAWLLTALQTAGVPADSALLSHGSDQLARMQQADGSWAGDDGAPDIHATLEALRALQSLG